MLKKFIINSMFIIGITTVHAQNDTTKQNFLDEAVISGIRAYQNVPVTHYNFNTKQLKAIYIGADMPSVLQYAPSIHTYSDNGTGIGYSFFRLRGIDQTRINVTVNGVPINDPQNQGTFFNNFADLLSSVHSVQVQRGVGSSTNGVAAFGGSVNVLTKPIQQNAEAEIYAGFGSFNSRRLTAEVHTGKFENNWGAYLRLSNIATDGFRQNSGSQINSYLFSIGKVTHKSLFKINLWGGDATSKLAYLGSDKQSLETNRKHNPISLGETDRFKQHFFQLQYQNQFNKHSGINTSAYFVRGMAPQFQFYFPADWLTSYNYFNMPEPIVGSDTIKTTNAMTSYRLNQFFYGAFVNYYYQYNRLRIDAGLHANTFISEHFMEAQWMQVIPRNITMPHRVYFNTGFKNEVSSFIKLNYSITEKLSAYSDIQVRTSTFKYKPQKMEIATNAFDVEDMQWWFFNPKFGLNHQLNKELSIYAMTGFAGREPTRFDYFLDDYATRNIKQNEVKPEYVTDIEAGLRVVNDKINANINAYYMIFENAIINTGETNNFGFAINTNIANSFRSGIEIDGRFIINKHISLTHSSNFSNNRIKSLVQFYQYYTDTATLSIPITFNNTQPALTPTAIINQGMMYKYFNNFFTELNFRYVSSQFVDNSSLKIAEINSFYVFDLKTGIHLKQWLKQDIHISCNINNILNNTYNTWGNVASFSQTVSNTLNGFEPAITPLFFAAPPRNYFITIHAKF